MGWLTSGLKGHQKSTFPSSPYYKSSELQEHLPQSSHQTLPFSSKQFLHSQLPSAIPPPPPPPPRPVQSPPGWQAPSLEIPSDTTSAYDQIQTKLNRVITSIDCESYDGRDVDAGDVGTGNNPEASKLQPPPAESARSGTPKPSKRRLIASPRVPDAVFQRVDQYANSKLPIQLPPVRLTPETWPLISKAAAFSQSVYETPKGSERSTYIDADWRSGTKAMVIKSVASTRRKVIVFAIRGTVNFMDWVVNMKTAPTSPVGFLDDPGNLCHTGFLSVARRMVAPVAARLRQLLADDPRCAQYSLIITGHSAGGAVASLLFAHMLSTSLEARSELNALMMNRSGDASGPAFRRVHCITFGTPPVTLLPLEKPASSALRNWLFISFVNEGDPVTRADPDYIRSLLELYSCPIPPGGCPIVAKLFDGIITPSLPHLSGALHGSLLGVHDKLEKAKSHQAIRQLFNQKQQQQQQQQQMPLWNVPQCTLSVPGNIYVLRSGKLFQHHSEFRHLVQHHRRSQGFVDGPPSSTVARKTVQHRADEGVVVQKVTDEQLRAMIWGDPVCHVMELYFMRIEALVSGAVLRKDTK